MATSATRPYYLDHNATTPLAPEVLDAMLPYLRDRFGNPSSGHIYGRQAATGVDRSRSEVAALLGCSPEEIIFTSGGTESNNIALRGLDMVGTRRTVVTSVIEHPAVLEPCRVLATQGVHVETIGVDPSGRICMAEALQAIGRETRLVSVMHANNETGAIQPLAALAELAHAHGALMHTDAAQSLGKIDVDVDALGVDLLSVAGHKFYGPKGVGALYRRQGLPLKPLIVGAGHELGLRAGTENVAGIVGLGAACALARRDLAQEQKRIRALRDRLLGLLRRELPELVRHGPVDDCLPNTLNFRLPDIRGSAVLALVPELAASTGSACHEHGEVPSRVLTAMGIDPEQALGALRLSLGRSTTAEVVDAVAELLVRVFRKSRAG